MYFKELIPLDKNNPVINIVHAADIHIRNSSRHDEFKKVFKLWYKQLKEQTPDLIVLVGDIIHSKTTISPEVVEMVYTLFKNLSKISDVIVIPGNHDINLSNIKRENVLSAIKKIHKIPNVYLLEKSGIYRYNNIDFYHCSLLDNNHPKEILDINQTNIALWHGTVDLSTNKYNHELRSKIYIDYFNIYDYTFLGDIHKKQSLDKEEKIQYPGSLICQNFGEQSEKGYLIWNLNEGKSTFQPIDNPNTFYTIYIRKNKFINIDEIKAKKPRIRIFIDDISLKSKNKFINDINKICKPIELSIHNELVNYSTTVNSKLRFNNFYDINVQNKLLKSFLNQRYTGITNNEIDKILELNKDVEELLENDGQYILPNYNSIWTLEKIEFDNLFRYGENNKIDFNNIKDITGIFGKNSSGKTSLFEIIFFALYGRTQKKINQLNVVNDKKNYCKVKVTLNINNVIHIIERKLQLKNTKKHTKVISENNLNFYKINEDDEILLNGDDKNKTEKNIRKLIGNPEDFLNTTMIPQNRSTKFIQSTSHRKKFISQMIGLEAIQKKFERAKTIYRKKNIILEDLLDKKYKAQFTTLINLINGLNLKINNLKIEKNELIETLKLIENDIKKKQIKINKSDIEIIDIKLLEQNKLNKENELNDLDKKLENIKQKLNKDKNKLNELNKKLEKYKDYNFNDIEKRYNQSRLEYNSINREIEKTKYIIKDKIKQTKILNEQPWCLEEEVCKKCSLLQSAFENRDMLINELSPKSDNLLKEKIEKKKLFESLEIIYNEHKNYISINNDIKILNQNIKFNEYKLNDFEKDINTIKNIDLKKIDKSLEIYYQNETKIKNNLELKNKIKELELLLKSSKKLIENKDKEITNLFIEKKTNESKKEDIVEEIHRIEKLDEECCYYKYYIEAMDKDNIPLQIIKDFLPEINRKITSVLEGTVPFSIQIEYDEDDDLSIYLIRNDGDRKIIESEGGMVNVIAGIALRVALIELSSLPKSTLFAIDEQFSALDNEVLSSINYLFDYIKNKFKNVLLITHLTSIKDDVDSVIEIHNDGKFSYVNV